MSRMSMFLSCLAVLTIAAGLSGCGDAASPDQAPEAPNGDDHAAGMPASTEVEEALAELPSEDRAAAAKQRICPVSDQALGSMGKPYKITHDGTDVYLCCEGCKKSFTDDPAKYLAKLDK